MLLKVIACEIAFREICHAAAHTPNLVDLEFLTQGHHDHPPQGRNEIQKRIDAVPAGRYDAVLVGYGLCSNILLGLHSTHTPLVVPRAHDCITWFLGSKERYQQCFTERPGTYYFTSGWLECRQRRGLNAPIGLGGLMPAQGTAGAQSDYEMWVQKYGEDQARYLMETMAAWANHYTHGVLIDFDFTKPLNLSAKVQQVCTEKGWQYQELPGDLNLLRRWIDGDWNSHDFLVAPPGHQVVATFDDAIIGAAPVG